MHSLQPYWVKLTRINLRRRGTCNLQAFWLSGKKVSVKLTSRINLGRRHAHSLQAFWWSGKKVSVKLTSRINLGMRGGRGDGLEKKRGTGKPPKLRCVRYAQSFVWSGKKRGTYGLHKPFDGLGKKARGTWYTQAFWRSGKKARCQQSTQAFSRSGKNKARLVYKSLLTVWEKKQGACGLHKPIYGLEKSKACAIRTSLLMVWKKSKVRTVCISLLTVWKKMRHARSTQAFWRYRKKSKVRCLQNPFDGLEKSEAHTVYTSLLKVWGKSETRAVCKPFEGLEKSVSEPYQQDKPWKAWRAWAWFFY